MTGEVISVARTGFYARIEDEIYLCLCKSFEGETAPVVNDSVEVEKREDKYFIVKINPRKNLIGRFDACKQKYQYFAANIDVVFIVTSANREFSDAKIRRFTALCENKNVRYAAVITKPDLGGKIPDLDCENITVNALEKNEAEKLFKYWAKDETAMLLGSSGVGKSTIINTLCELSLKTREVQPDRRHNKGRHTTSGRTLYFLKDGRKIVDNPGVRFVDTD
jgi:ribosome biogenesis GTPase